MIGARWQVGRIVDASAQTIADAWRFEGRHTTLEAAICSLVFELGEAVISEERPDAPGIYLVRAVETGELVACVRQDPADLPVAPVGVADRVGLGPLRRWRGLSWVGWLNYLLLRWFFVRLYYVLEDDDSISRYGLRWWPSWRWR